MRGWVLGIGVLLVVASCGGSGSGDEGSAVEALEGDVFTVSSSDGKAILTLTADALPESVNAEDLQVDWSRGASTEPGAPLVGVRILPDGLALGQSASLRFELPETDGNQFMIAHVSGDAFEFIAGEIESVREQRFMVVSIEHFSSVTVYGTNDLTTVITTASPSLVSVGQTQLVESEVWIEPIAFGIWMPVSLGADEQWQLITFDDAVLSQYSYDRDGSVYWHNHTPSPIRWDPVSPSSVMTQDDAVVYLAASSTCTDANSIYPEVRFEIHVSMTVTAKGPIVNRTLLDMALVFDEDRVTAVPGFEKPSIPAVGAKVKGEIHLLEHVESECTDVPATTPPTVSTLPPGGDEDEVVSVPQGMDPRAHVVSVEPVVTANGTQGFNVIFGQPWAGLPDLFSFFVELNITSGECSITAGVETHAGTVTPVGPGPWWLLDDGSAFIDTGCDFDPSAPIDIIGRSGSWEDEATTQPVFADFAFGIDPDVVANAPGPFDMGRVVDNLGAAPVPLDLDGFQISGASNDGSGKMTVDFQGPVKDLVEGDEYIVDFRVEASEGGIRAFATLRNIGGELIPNGATFNDADEVNGTIDGKGVDAVWEWTTDHQIVVTMVSTEGVPIPSRVPSVTVTVKLAGSTDEYTFTR